MRLSNMVVRLRLASAALAAVAFAAAPLGCASDQTVSRFGQIAPGMSKDEVIELLGKPSSRWPLEASRNGFDGERLQWGDSLSSIASSAAFEGDPDRAYCVVFDADGRVVSSAAPAWVAEEAADEATLRARREARGEP